MKKTVLFLMNGFGIEMKDSYSVYNSKLMPNLDSYTQKYLFSSIQANTYNFNNGYRMFSTGSILPLTYSLMDNYMDKFGENPNMNFYLSNIDIDSKVHLFMFLENDKSLEHLKKLIKFIRTKCSNKIFIHVVLTSPDINNYKELEHLISKINYEFSECKIGTIIGVNVLKSSNIITYMNLLKNELGERWLEVSRKFNALINWKTPPCDAKEFYVNNGFKFDDKDVCFFFNYEHLDLTNLLFNIRKITSVEKYFSMFPISGVTYSMFAYPMSRTSMTEALNKIDAKALVLSDGNYIPCINYMANGLNNVIPNNISYTRTDNEVLTQSKLESIIKLSNYDLIIINFQIDNFNNLSELQDNLSKLDVVLKIVHDICVENSISLFISSLYGIKKEIAVDNFTKGLIDFSVKVPVIVIDSVFNKENFRLDYGNIFNLAHTVYTNINNQYNEGEVLIKRKSSLEKMLKK